MRLKRKLKQYAVYWPPAKPGLDASVSFGNPIEIKVRWEDCAEIMLSPEGDKWTSTAAIDSDYKMLRNGVLWKGRLSNVRIPSTEPMSNPGASTIRKVDDIPNLRANEEGYTAYL